MRDFIYLDMNRVNSIIAQSENGILQSLTIQEQTKAGAGKDFAVSGKSSSQIGGGLGKIARIEENIDVGIDYSRISNKESLTSKIREISVHDAAFAIAYDYLKPIRFPDDFDHVGIGAQIELSDEFRFVDFDFVDTLYSENGVINWAAKDNLKNTVREFEKQFSLEERSNPQVQQTLNDLRKTVEEEFRTNQELIRIIKLSLPFTRMLVSNKGFVIPLNDKYFRDDPQIGIFKFGGILTCVGTVTNEYIPDKELNSDLFTQIPFQVFELLKAVLELPTDGFCILNPIAVYYDLLGE